MVIWYFSCSEICYIVFLASGRRGWWCPCCRGRGFVWRWWEWLMWKGWLIGSEQATRRYGAAVVEGAPCGTGLVAPPRKPVGKVGPHHGLDSVAKHHKWVGHLYWGEDRMAVHTVHKDECVGHLYHIMYIQYMQYIHDVKYICVHAVHTVGSVLEIY